MDAKPQRLRAQSRVLRDENALPSNMPQTKTLHSRNKSTPALSSLLKNPVKSNSFLPNDATKLRPVLDDVSNFARGTLSNKTTAKGAKDDLSILKNATNVLGLKTSTLQPLREMAAEEPQYTKQPALLRPAQRPLSAALPKLVPAPAQQTSSRVSNNNPVQFLVHPEEFVQSKEPEESLQASSDKPTTMPQEERPQQPTTLDQEITANTKEIPESFASTAPVHQVLSGLHEVKVPSLPSAAPVQPPVLSQSDALNVKEEVQDYFSRDLIKSIEQTFARAGAVLNPVQSVHDLPTVPMLPSQHSSQETVPQIESEPRSNTVDEYLPLPPVQHEQPVRAVEHCLPTLEIPQTHEASNGGVKLPASAHSDIPEYFEEDEEEYYDAEGYTTARSIRSRGDNTTGGLTTFVEPRVTARVMRELEAAAAFVRATQSEDDIEDEAWDTSMVAEYGDDIFEYMHTLENKMRPNEHYMDNQNEIQWSMRSVLMDWMIQVHTRFSLLPETLFLAVNYVDRFLSCKVVSLGKLQLVGATALFVAAKYEEINCPSVQEIVYMVDNAYSVDEILKAERFMLTMLQFELGWPGPMSFLRRISKADEYDLDTRTMAKYFLEVMIMDERFVACAPSFASAAAHCLSRLILDKGDWSLAHVHYSQYTYCQLHDIVVKLVECCREPRKHHMAVYDKYQEKKYKRCSLVVESKLKNVNFHLPSRNTSNIHRESSSSNWTNGSFWRRF